LAQLSKLKTLKSRLQSKFQVNLCYIARPFLKKEKKKGRKKRRKEGKKGGRKREREES
jgi:hypothetical protein